MHGGKLNLNVNLLLSDHVDFVFVLLGSFFVLFALVPWDLRQEQLENKNSQRETIQCLRRCCGVVGMASSSFLLPLRVGTRVFYFEMF